MYFDHEIDLLRTVEHFEITPKIAKSFPLLDGRQKVGEVIKQDTASYDGCMHIWVLLSKLIVLLSLAQFQNLFKTHGYLKFFQCHGNAIRITSIWLQSREIKPSSVSSLQPFPFFKMQSAPMTGILENCIEYSFEYEIRCS